MLQAGEVGRAVALAIIELNPGAEVVDRGAYYRVLVDGRGTVTGDLTFHGVTKPVTLDAVFNGSGPGMMGAGTRMGFSGTGRIKRSEFGVTNAKQFAGDDIDLEFEIEFVKK